MFSFIIKRLFKSPNEKFLEKLKPIIQQINAIENDMQQISDDELRGQTQLMRNIVADAKQHNSDITPTMNVILPKAFATMREASKRVLGKRHYDVQLLGGIVMHRGLIAEMRTGEGKTLAATLPAYLNGLSCDGVHIVTTNDYLVKRDAEWMGPLYTFLSMQIGCILSGMTDEDKKTAYNADVTYGTNNEFGFDYLRDNLKYNRASMVQRPFNYAIVDELDSVLIDEARTPLIISGSTDDNPILYTHINTIIENLVRDDYEVDEKLRNVMLTDNGIHNVEKSLQRSKIIADGSSLYDIENIHILHHVNQSLKAHTLFKMDVDYIVRDKKVMIVDEHTGRVMDGRRYSDGLHQSIEAKEKVKIHSENQTIASITFQNYFRMYPKLSGMTGTAMKEATELAEIYNLQVVSVPTNVPIQCVHDDDVIYRTAKEKYTAIINEIKAANAEQQPVLVGTISVEKSEYISSLLKKEGIKHNILNAKHHAMEAEIIGQAGRPGVVTIATNMAGRGTDIILGGNPEMLASTIMRDKHRQTKEQNPDLYKKILLEVGEQLLQEREIVKRAGGLFVIGSERHESRRIDDQLRGRAGRQGDEGRTKFFLSMEDDLMRLFGSDKISNLLLRMGLKENEAIVHPLVSRSLEKAQQKVEARNYEIRKNLLQYDDVVNEQRQVVYSKRHSILDLPEQLPDLVRQLSNHLLERLVGIFATGVVDEWDIENLDKEIHRTYGIEHQVQQWMQMQDNVHDSKNVKLQLISHLNGQIQQQLSEKIEQTSMNRFVVLLQNIWLITLDHLWKDHLYSLDQLRTGITLRSYGQKNPLLEYKHDAFNMFSEMLESVNEQVIERAFNIHIDDEDVMSANNISIKQGVVSPTVSRNDPCYCGSGKRYKHCHGKLK